MTINFAIAPINWTNDDDPSLGGDIPLSTCLREMQDAGYSGCELGNKFPKDASSLLKVTTEFGLSITSDWIGTKFTEHDFDAEIKSFRDRICFLKSIGVRALKVCEVGHAIQQTSRPIFHHKVTFSDSQWQKLFHGLRAMGQIARESSMFIAYHHHLGTGVENRSEIDFLMDNLHADLVSLLPDTGHLYAAGTDPLAVFERYHARIKYVHLKDVRSDILSLAKNNKLSFMDAVRAGVFTVPGDGVINFTPIFQSLVKHNYDGWLVVEAEQDPKKANPLDYAKKSRAYLREFFGH